MAYDVAGAVEAASELGTEAIGQVGEAVNHTKANESILADNEGERRVELSRHQLKLAQIQTNLAEIKTASLFKGGWRPAIGWVCALSLAAYYLPQFILGAATWAAMCWVVIKAAMAAGTLSTVTLPPYPASVDGLMELVLGMLGMAGLRTVEKFTGVTGDATLSKRERAKILRSSAPEAWAEKFGGGQ